jgi:hypothetical protein
MVTMIWESVLIAAMAALVCGSAVFALTRKAEILRNQNRTQDLMHRNPMEDDIEAVDIDIYYAA